MSRITAALFSGGDLFYFVRYIMFLLNPLDFLFQFEFSFQIFGVFSFFGVMLLLQKILLSR